MMNPPLTAAERRALAEQLVATMGGTVEVTPEGQLVVQLPIPADATDEDVEAFLVEARALGFGAAVTEL